MRPQAQPVTDLPNIGPTIALRLREIGIETRADLEAMGPVVAYLRMRARNPAKTLPVCYYLYSLEGALSGRHWDAIGPRTKQSLRSQVEQEG